MNEGNSFGSGALERFEKMSDEKKTKVETRSTRRLGSRPGGRRPKRPVAFSAQFDAHSEQTVSMIHLLLELAACEDWESPGARSLRARLFKAARSLEEELGVEGSVEEVLRGFFRHDKEQKKLKKKSG